MAIMQGSSRSTPIHRLTPITKLLMVLLFWLTALLTFDKLALGVMIAVALIMWVIARIPLSSMKSILAVTGVVFVIFVTINGFMFYGGETVLFRIFGIPYWYEGMMFGISICLKILTVVTIVPILTMTTPLPTLLASLSKLRLPYKAIFTLGMAFHLVPLVSQTYSDITDSQYLRGYDVKEMNYIKRVVKGYVPIFIPLVLTLLRRSGDLDIAIESRGFGAPVERTYFNEVKMKTLDYTALGLFLLAFLFVAYVAFFGGGMRMSEFIQFGS